MRRIIVVLALNFSVFLASANADEIISKESFTKKYVSMVVGKADGFEYQIKGDLEVEFTSNEGEKSTSYLDNAYRNYLSQPEKLNQILDGYSSSYTSTFDNINDEMGVENIFPVVKDIGYIRQIEDVMERETTNRSFPYYYEEINSVLYVVYALDTPESIRFIPKEEMAKFGVDKSDLRSISKENLRRSVPSIGVQGDPSRVSMLVADGYYEASFLLFDDLWTKENFPVKGEIVVYIPSRDTVLITGSEDVEGLKKVRGMVRDPENQWSHMISESGFIRSGSGWEVFDSE